RPRPAEQPRDLAAVADRLVGEGTYAGHAQPARDQEDVARPRVHLERASERAQHVDSITRPQPREPLGPAAHGPEVDGERASDRIDRVEREGPAQHEPGVVTGSDVDELAGPGARHELRSVVRLEPLAGQDLATVDELRA